MDYIDNKKGLSVTEEKIEYYHSLLEKHRNYEIPYTDHSFYKELMSISKDISENAELESWYVLEQYIELNIETMDIEFLVETIKNFSKINFFRFKFWYTIENRIVKEYKSYTNLELAKIVYSLSYVEKGSDYIYRIIAEELMKRKISSLNEEEFILVYNSYIKIKMSNKVFNLMLDKARKEIYSYL